MGRPNASKAKILDAAADLAARRGVSATTVDDIATLAGVAKGSVYYNFESKDAIFASLIDDAVGSAIEAVREARLAAAADRVAAIATAFIERVGDRAHRAKVVFGELLRTDRPWREALEAHRAAMLAEIRLGIEQDGGDATMLRASAVFGAIVMVAFERTAFEPDRSIAECVAAVVG